MRIEAWESAGRRAMVARALECLWRYEHPVFLYCFALVSFVLVHGHEYITPVGSDAICSSEGLCCPGIMGDTQVDVGLRADCDDVVVSSLQGGGDSTRLVDILFFPVFDDSGHIFYRNEHQVVHKHVERTSIDQLLEKTLSLDYWNVLYCDFHMDRIFSVSSCLRTVYHFFSDVCAVVLWIRRFLSDTWSWYAMRLLWNYLFNNSFP